MAVQLLGGKDKVCQFVCDAEDSENIVLLEPEEKRRILADSSALPVIRKISGLESPMEIQSIEKKARLDLLAQLKKAGLTVRQLERLTGINRNIIQRAK